MFNNYRNVRISVVAFLAVAIFAIPVVFNQNTPQVAIDAGLTGNSLAWYFRADASVSCQAGSAIVTMTVTSEEPRLMEVWDGSGSGASKLFDVPAMGSSSYPWSVGQQTNGGSRSFDLRWEGGAGHHGFSVSWGAIDCTPDDPEPTPEPTNTPMPPQVNREPQQQVAAPDVYSCSIDGVDQIWVLDTMPVGSVFEHDGQEYLTTNGGECLPVVEPTPAAAAHEPQVCQELAVYEADVEGQANAIRILRDGGSLPASYLLTDPSANAVAVSLDTTGEFFAYAEQDGANWQLMVAETLNPDRKWSVAEGLVTEPSVNMTGGYVFFARLDAQFGWGLELVDIDGNFIRSFRGTTQAFWLGTETLGYIYNGVVWAMDIPDRTFTRLSEPNWNVVEATASTDGKAWAFTLQGTNGSTRVYKHNADGSGFQAVGDSPALNADGSILAYRQNGQIWVYALQNESVIQQITDLTGDVSQFAFYCGRTIFYTHGSNVEAVTYVDGAQPRSETQVSVLVQGTEGEVNYSAHTTTRPELDEPAWDQLTVEGALRVLTEVVSNTALSVARAYTGQQVAEEEEILPENAYVVQDGDSWSQILVNMGYSNAQIYGETGLIATNNLNTTPLVTGATIVIPTNIVVNAPNQL